jgi:hypothetical protein
MARKNEEMQDLAGEELEEAGMTERGAEGGAEEKKSEEQNGEGNKEDETSRGARKEGEEESDIYWSEEGERGAEGGAEEKKSEEQNGEGNKEDETSKGARKEGEEESDIYWSEGEKREEAEGSEEYEGIGRGNTGVGINDLLWTLQFKKKNEVIQTGMKMSGKRNENYWSITFKQRIKKEGRGMNTGARPKNMDKKGNGSKRDKKEKKRKESREVQGEEDIE